jgi:hypothetical protein
MQHITSETPQSAVWKALSARQGVLSMVDPAARRRWRVVMPLALVVLLALAWSGFWYFAAAKAETMLTQWREREAKAGRIHSCASQSVGGFPFRIEVRCAEPATELRGGGTAVALHGKNLLAAVQVYDPTLVISEFTGPMTVAAPGQPAAYEADWTLAQSSVRGTPFSPQRVSIVVDGPTVERLGDGVRTPVLKASRIELYGRLAEGSTAADPLIEVVLRLAAAAAPELHPLTREPLDADISATLRGLADFMPKPWPARFREIQERNGSIEITKARVQQGEVIAVSAGTLSLTARGTLQGQLQVTMVGVEQVLKKLDLDRMISQGQVGQTIDALDRLMPGLGSLARQNARPSILAGLGAFGQTTTLEGKPAVSLPLKFTDGEVMLGPFGIGRVPPLF